jgi:hypothetical protein
MVNKSQLCDNECLNPIPRGQRRIVPIPESPFQEYSTTTTLAPTTTTSTTTAYPEGLNSKVIYPSEQVACPVVFPQITATIPPSAFSLIGGIIRTYVHQGVSYRSHTFLYTGELTVSILDGNPSSILSVDVLLVAGGGGGGSQAGGGGGGGGGYLESFSKLRLGNYAIIVGDGGSPDQNGQNSSFNQLIAFGGGAGGSFGLPGKSGGSGGGAGQSSLLTGGQGLQGQGFNGGGVDIIGYASGGGGGASESALNITQTYLASTGGAGKFNSFMDGSIMYYAGGGGGGSFNYNGQGGIGGGGSQIQGLNKNGQENRGGGGAGAKNNIDANAVAGRGGSGTVIIRYRI